MSKITDFDKNFDVDVLVNRDFVDFYRFDEEFFRLYGVFYKDGKFRRMPEETAKSVSDAVHFLHTNTSGGRLRFVSDSDIIAIRVAMDNFTYFPTMPFCGISGFDLYETTDDGEYVYLGSFMCNTHKDGYESQIILPERKRRLLTIEFPLYNDVNELYIGLGKNTVNEKAPDYTKPGRVVYYGSSITQGGCASKPGDAYQNIISRRFDMDFLNLGFSGSALAEDSMIDYLCSLDMDIFVLDYDYNAPNAAYLEKTHEKLFSAVRKAKPDLPVIILPHPKYTPNADDTARFEVVKRTYDNAIAKGDKNVWYIPAKELVGDLLGNDYSVDGCHPTSAGFLFMAKAVGDVIETILNR